MRTNNKLWYCLLALFSAMLITTTARAQVTIGAEADPQSFSVLELVSNGTGGLRLPQLSTSERDALGAATSKPLSYGLTIYNKDNNCIEYWNSKRWVSLCTGNAEFTFKDDSGNKVDPTIDPNNVFPPEGDTKGPWTPEGVPPCTGNPVPYGVTVVAGTEYTTVNILDPATGRFTVTMDENPTALVRTAIIRITNNCTSEYKDFLFTQVANTSLCQPGIAKPVIATTNNTGCAGGAAYMGITNPDASATYIWTCNNVEFKRGSNWAYADKKGIYRVYVGAVGCMTNASDIVNISIITTEAPTPAPGITAENGGVVCSGSGGITLTATGYADANKVTWLKDGIIKGTGATFFVTEANASAGGNDWIAVISEGSCTSLPSNVIRVVKSSSTALAKPTVLVNGLNINAVTYCKGGMLTVKITNTSAYTGKNVRFIFKNGNEVLSVTRIDDSTYQYKVPTTTENMVFSVMVEETSGTSCSGSVSSEPTVLTKHATSKPTVTSSSAFLVCGTTPAVLNSSILGTGYTYTWYNQAGMVVKSGSEGFYSTTTPGFYSVSVTTPEGCISEQSNQTEVKLSSPPVISFSGASPQAVNVGDTRAFSIFNDYEPATYSWSATNATLISSANKTAQFSFPTVGNAKVTVTATNSCGTVTQNYDVTVNSLCTEAVISGVTPSPVSQIEGDNLNLSVTLSQGTSPAYQWYKDGSIITGATASTYNKTNITTADAGTYYVEVKACEVTKQSDNITVSVVPNPARLDAGTGTLTGKTCFDIAESNDNANGCGLLSGRKAVRANFNNQATYEQAYTFTPSGTVSKVRFAYVETNGAGKIIQSMTPTNSSYATGTNITTACTVKVTYKTNLSSPNPDAPSSATALGLTTANAFKVDIYAIYNDNATGTGIDKAVKLTAQVKDCACCGAMTTSGQWLNFMCYNLGADETLDPFTWNNSKGNSNGSDIKGDLYQWGRPKNGHEKRNSSSFIKVVANTPYDDWGSTNTSWGDGTQNANMAKATNDPCPAGWKVPSIKQWQSIFSTSIANGQPPSAATANIWTWTGAGYKIGQTLYLPAAGARLSGDGSLQYIMESGFYWSSTTRDINASHIFFKNTYIHPQGGLARAVGCSIRCVLDQL